MKTRFMAAHFFLWTISASFLSYITSLGLERGMQPADISVMIAAFLLSSFAGQLLWGYVCDKIGSDRKIFLLCGVCAAVLFVITYFAPDNTSFGIGYVLLGMFYFPMGSILDSWLLKVFSFDRKTYSIAKACDSISNGLWMPVMGVGIARLGHGVMPVAAVGMTGITLALAWGLKDSRDCFSSDTSDKVTVSQAFAIVKHLQMAILLGITLLCGLAFVPLNNLKLLLIESLGGDVAFQGIDAFGACLVQFLFFLLAGKMKMKEAGNGLIAALLLFFAAAFVFLAAPGYVWILPGSMLFSAGYALLVTVTRSYVGKLVEGKLQTTANSLFDAAYRSLAGVIGMLYSGSLTQAMGAKAMACLAGVYMMAALLLMLLFYRKMCLKEI